MLLNGFSVLWGFTSIYEQKWAKQRIPSIGATPSVNFVSYRLMKNGHPNCIFVDFSTMFVWHTDLTFFDLFVAHEPKRGPRMGRPR
jgi:hypothetical protein